MKTNKVHRKNKAALEHASGLTIKELREIATQAEEKLTAWGVDAPGAMVQDKGVTLERRANGWYYLRNTPSLKLTKQQEAQLKDQYEVK
jgi:hypothetical protein